MVGSTRRGPVGRVTPGSTAERLLHGAPCPVAVTPAKLAAGWTPRHVGVGFVDVEDAQAVDRVFSMLMGDQVEPRREFIEQNAKNVKFLDV